MLQNLIAHQMRFQSTLPRGERQTEALTKGEAILDFNPRSREGSDTTGRNKEIGTMISIHAPARGATAAGVRNTPYMGISIHAPARGATNPLFEALNGNNFNPRSREGSDVNQSRLGG